MASIANGVVTVAPRTGTYVSVAAVGDLDFAGDTYLSLMQAGPAHIFREVKPILSRNSAIVVSLESVLVVCPYNRLEQHNF